MNPKITRTALTTLVAVAALATAAAPADAAGDKGFKMAEFKVSIEGTQAVEWKKHADDEGYCSRSYDGVGDEYVKWKTPKPVKVSAFMAPGSKSPAFLVGDGPPFIDTRATVKRKLSETYGPQDPLEECPGGGPAGPEKKPDCGKKTVTWEMNFGFDFYDTEQVFLAGHSAPDPFKKCPGVGNDGFSKIIGQSGTGGIRKLPELPARELFDEDIGKLIVLGKGSKKVTGSSYSSEGLSRWNITFKRIKPKR